MPASLRLRANQMAMIEFISQRSSGIVRQFSEEFFALFSKARQT
jgi:hypothetical protein